MVSYYTGVVSYDMGVATYHRGVVYCHTCYMVYHSFLSTPVLLQCLVDTLLIVLQQCTDRPIGNSSTRISAKYFRKIQPKIFQGNTKFSSGCTPVTVVVWNSTNT